MFNHVHNLEILIHIFQKKHECKTPPKNIHEKHPRTVHTHFRRTSATPRVTKNESKINHPRGRKGEHHALLSSFQTWEKGFQHLHSLKLVSSDGLFEFFLLYREENRRCSFIQQMHLVVAVFWGCESRKGFPSYHSSWVGSGNTESSTQQSSISTTFLVSSPKNGKLPCWGVDWTCPCPYKARSGARRKRTYPRHQSVPEEPYRNAFCHLSRMLRAPVL